MGQHFKNYLSIVLIVIVITIFTGLLGMVPQLIPFMIIVVLVVVSILYVIALVVSKIGSGDSTKGVPAWKTTLILCILPLLTILFIVLPLTKYSFDSGPAGLLVIPLIGGINLFIVLPAAMIINIKVAKSYDDSTGTLIFAFVIALLIGLIGIFGSPRILTLGDEIKSAQQTEFIKKLGIEAKSKFEITELSFSQTDNERLLDVKTESYAPYVITAKLKITHENTYDHSRPLRIHLKNQNGAQFESFFTIVHYNLHEEEVTSRMANLEASKIYCDFTQNINLEIYTDQGNEKSPFPLQKIQISEELLTQIEDKFRELYEDVEEQDELGLLKYKCED